VIRFFRGRALVQIEIKSGTPVAPVLSALRAAVAESWVVVASFEPAIVHEAARLAPAIPRMLIAERHRRRAWLLGHIEALGATGVSIDRRAIKSADFVRWFHDRGIKVWCWTVNRPADLRQLAAFGVDSIIGDDPRLMLRVLEPGIPVREN
jgi:glycerophosphoryl diester phosphodiesterase